ncbi:MAG: hypothetical protein AAGI88_00455 [Pseudomonadota bacterium]
MKKTQPTSSTRRSQTPAVASSSEVSEFLSRAKNLQRYTQGRSRLIFAIDATASRQPTWDLACSLQADMFRASADVASLSIQLAFYRGMGEVTFTGWQNDPENLAQTMSRVACHAGRTQIGRLLSRAISAQARHEARALVFIGDAVEESEAHLTELAGRCRLLKMPLFLFQEGRDPQVQDCFQAMARISGGAYAHFDMNSAERLRELLGAVARYAAGGRAALENKRSPGSDLLLSQLPQARD